MEQMEAKQYAPHQQRVVDEYSQLTEKIEKLSWFMDHDIYPTLPGIEKARMLRQYRIMLLYHEVLAERIAAF